jgi:putative hemolysin
MDVILGTTLLMLAAVLFQALFAGYETGFVSVNPIRIRFLAEEERQKKAVRLLRYTNRPDQMLAMLLIGTNIGTVAGTIVASAGYGELAATIIATPVFLLFAEILPKSIFRMYPNRLTLRLLPLMDFWYVVFAPLAWPIALMTRIMFRSKEDEDQHLSPLMKTREDVRVLVDETADHGAIAPSEQEMIHRVINLQATQAKEIMVPRIDIQGLPATTSRTELLDLLVESGRSRICIYEDTIDKVIGVATAHDVLLDETPDRDDIERFITPVTHVPDTARLDNLFETMKEEKQHIVIVTDEYGGTDGLLTLEDILEEIFGEIQDEHDDEKAAIVQVGPDSYIMDARVPLVEAAEATDLPLVDKEIETVGGYILRLAGRIPARGEVIEENGLRVTVLEARASRVARVRIDILPEARKADDPTTD